MKFLVKSFLLGAPGINNVLYPRDSKTGLCHIGCNHNLPNVFRNGSKYFVLFLGAELTVKRLDEHGVMVPKFKPQAVTQVINLLFACQKDQDAAWREFLVNFHHLFKGLLLVVLFGCLAEVHGDWELASLDRNAIGGTAELTGEQPFIFSEVLDAQSSRHDH